MRPFLWVVVTLIVAVEYKYSRDCTEQIRTGNGNCDTDFGGRWRRCSEMTSKYVLPRRLYGYCSLSITMRVVVDQSSLHRLAILHIGVPSPGIFLMAALAQPRCFDWRAQIVLCQQKKICCSRRLAWLVDYVGSVQSYMLRLAPNLRFWSPYLLGHAVISTDSGLGCGIFLGNCWHSLLLLASGECEFHTWRQISLFSANLVTASHAKQSGWFKSSENPTEVTSPD